MGLTGRRRVISFKGEAADSAARRIAATAERTAAASRERRGDSGGHERPSAEVERALG